MLVANNKFGAGRAMRCPLVSAHPQGSGRSCRGTAKKAVPERFASVAANNKFGDGGGCEMLSLEGVLETAPKPTPAHLQEEGR